jgi:hypothetical protein
MSGLPHAPAEAGLRPPPGEPGGGVSPALQDACEATPPKNDVPEAAHVSDK